jgi:putative nucleotidyltransferase with HDIG domain
MLIINKGITMTRDQAWDIVCQHVKNVNLRNHMLAVEAAMATYAKKYGEDEERWRVAGLLHDFDWEIHPTLDEHPQKGAQILRDLGIDEDMIRTIQSHASHTGVARQTLIDKALFACDEVTGLIVATALVRPDTKLATVEVKSIKKKFKQPSFAAGVNRQEVIEGADELGVDLWQDHVPTVLAAMQEISDELGL